MSSSPDPVDTVRLTELGDIVASIPFMFGFQPAESLVVVSLEGPRDRLAFSMRLDLPPEEADGQIAAEIAVRMAHAGAEQVLVLVYTDTAVATGELPRRALVEAVQRALPMPVRDAVLVMSDRIWSYLCADPVCCPPQGRRLDPEAPGSIAVAAAHALHGTAVLPSREAVVASVAPLGGIAAVSMRQAIERAWSQRRSVGSVAARRSARILARELIGRYEAPPAELSHDEAAALVVGLHDVRLRDELMAWSLDDGGPMRALLRDLARHAMPPDDAPACTTLAWVAYVHGDGVVTSTALERALATDPDYGLADLLSRALVSQIAPSELRAAMSDFDPRSAALPSSDQG